MTKAESEFALLLEAHAITGFMPEYLFHPIRRWRFDFAHPGTMVAIEIEGGTWGYRDRLTGQMKVGRHATGKGMADDMEKYNAAAELGWRVLRYTPEMSRKQEAVDQIRACCLTILSVGGKPSARITAE